MNNLKTFETIGYIATYEKQSNNCVVVINRDIENDYIELTTIKRLKPENVGLLYRFKIVNNQLIDFYTI